MSGHPLPGIGPARGERRPVLLTVAAAVGVLALGACSDEAETDPHGEVVGVNAGVDEQVGEDVTIADVELEPRRRGVRRG